MTSEEPIDIETVLSNAPLRAFHFIVVGLSAFMIMLDGYDAQSIAFAAPLLAKALGRDVSSFGPMFGVGLVGLMLGSLAVSLLADRYGRKWLLIMSTVIFGLFSLAPALDLSFERLFVYRLLTGFGLGGAMPCAVALTSEYAPRHNKAVLVNIMFAGFPLGAVVGGFVVSLIIANWGWQAIFYLGGILPLLMVPVLMLLMPESIVFLVADGKRPRATARILNRFESTNALNPPNIHLSHNLNDRRGSVTNLFDQRRGFGTILLWIGFFCNLLLIYFLIN
jgi:MFS transporter, AAHS family, 4-hydroxybenzoate transporter